MLKINTPVLYLTLAALICFAVSCGKSGHVENKLPDTTAKPDISIDTSKNITEPLKDTLTDTINKPGPDSSNVLAEKKRKKDSLKTLKENEVKIKAYYFHPTARCVTCRNIEAYSVEAIQQWEEKNGKDIDWNELNIEDSVNTHFTDEFDLQFSSLIIVQYVGGEKVKWKKLEETWKLVNDKETFIKYVMNELNQFDKVNKKEKGAN